MAAWPSWHVIELDAVGRQFKNPTLPPIACVRRRRPCGVPGSGLGLDDADPLTVAGGLKKLRPCCDHRLFFKEFGVPADATVSQDHYSRK